VSRELIERFQTLYQKKYGESIAYVVAELQLKELAELVRTIAPKQEIKQNA
jgi:hypothetical protein